MKRLKGKVAVVTGASSGMGRAIAMRFSEEGAKVIAVARRTERLEILQREAGNAGGLLYPFSGDMMKPEDVAGMIDFAMQQCGRLDILVNNAGVLDKFGTAAEVTDDVWNRVLRINLTAPMEAMRKSIPLMLNNKTGGTIINISSVGGLKGAAGGAAYVASKHALIGLTKNTAIAYANDDIRVNAICPGSVETEIGDFDPKDVSQIGLGQVMKGNSFGLRIGKADEIAKVALFLASDEASYVNGAILPVDGGWLAG